MQLTLKLAIMKIMTWPVIFLSSTVPSGVNEQLVMLVSLAVSSLILPVVTGKHRENVLIEKPNYKF